MVDNPGKTLILIPAYNASRYLPELINRMRKAVDNADIFVVNDGSTDNTAVVLKELNVPHLTNSPNRGKGFALQRGFDHALKNRYNYVVTIDADLQHLPEELSSFTGSDIKAGVYIGTRDLRSSDMPLTRRLTNYLTSLIISIFSGRRIRDTQSGYRMISAETLRRVRVRSVKYDFESEFLFQAGMLDVNIAEVPISTIYEESLSYINPLKDTGRFITLIWKRILL